MAKLNILSAKVSVISPRLRIYFAGLFCLPKTNERNNHYEWHKGFFLGGCHSLGRFQENERTTRKRLIKYHGMAQPLFMILEVGELAKMERNTPSKDLSLSRKELIALRDILQSLDLGV